MSAPALLPAKASERARVLFLIAVVATAVIPHVPYGVYVAWPLVLLSTLAHELGHGFTALVVGGQFQSFRMWPDGSGVAAWGGVDDRLRLAIVAAGGLVGPAFTAMAFFVLGRKARGARVCLALVGLLLLAVELLLVRNPFGMVFVGVVAAAALLIAVKAPEWLAQASLVFVATELALSVFTRADYLFTATAHTAGGTMPSDVEQMAQALFLPFFVWGALCGLVSLFALLVGLRIYLRQ